jgi:hypothetical protein
MTICVTYKETIYFQIVETKIYIFVTFVNIDGAEIPFEAP